MAKFVSMTLGFILLVLGFDMLAAEAHVTGSFTLYFAVSILLPLGGCLVGLALAR